MRQVRKSKVRRGAATKRPNRRTRSSSATRPAAQLPHETHGLTLAQYSFCVAYLANGFNATRAYADSHAGVTYGTAGVEGYRSLRNPKIVRFLSERLEEAWKPYQMGGEQALGRVGLLASGVDDEGERIKVRDQLGALRTILEVTGKVKGLGESIDALAEAIKGDLAKHGEAQL